MKNIFFLTFLCAMIMANAMSAKGYAMHKKHKSVNRTTVADPHEENYDIKYLKFRLHVTDTSVYVNGNVTTTAQVIATAMGSYVFELDTLMIIDSAKVNGVSLPVVTTGATIRTITLPTTLTAGGFFTAQVFYHGVPPSGSGFFNGLTHSVSSGGTNIVYSVSDPYAAADWWPCKQDINDKIDSEDMYITVPRGVVDGSNGVLLGVDSTSTPGYWTYHWQTHYAIDYYLLSIAVARYAEYRSYMHFSGSTDSMLIENFLMDTATFNPLYKANFDSIGLIVDYYSSLYGRYPFWKEKYGVCYSTLPGGMEHQTMTTIGIPQTVIIAHELCHQWFGDYVTYATWGDVWLSEGFATFSEQVFINHFQGAAASLAHRRTYLAEALGDYCGEVYVTDTTSAYTLFYQPTVYAKGQGVVTMLRYLAPTDSMFFQVLRDYLATYRFGNASTADLKAVAESVYGFSLDTFFNQWIYGKGYPEYRVSWNQSGSTVYVRLVQTTSCPATTPIFSTPLELQLHSASADTIIKVYNNADTTVYSFTWEPTMTDLYFNPDVWTICRQLGLVKHDVTLSIPDLALNNIKVRSNPAKNFWEINQLPQGASLILLDKYGQQLWKGTADKSNSAIIPAGHLPAGDYLLKISSSKDTQSVKLVHW